jgi:8-oxo-dGTP diphosphatase
MGFVSVCTSTHPPPILHPRPWVKWPRVERGGTLYSATFNHNSSRRFYNHMTNKEVAVAVAILIKPNGEFLLAQRPEGKVYAGWWEFPGGKVEPNESVIDALKRELHEELGVDITHAYPWLTIRHEYAHANVRLHVYRVTQWHGEPHGKENQAFQWQSIANLTVSPLLPAAAPMIKALALPNVYAITNAAELGEAEFFLRLDRALDSGLKMIQVREKSFSPEQLQSFAQKVIRKAQAHNAKVLLNSDLALAKTLQADGVHLTSAQLMAMTSRPDFSLVSASCHNQIELQQAAKLGCDFVVLGPIKPTQSHPDAKILGWDNAAKLIADYSLPVYALGGMQESDREVAWINAFQGLAMQRAFYK